MESNYFKPMQPPIKPSLFVANPRLKTLLLVLIFVFLFSGLGLALLSQLQTFWRQQMYEQTQAGLPIHKALPIDGGDRDARGCIGSAGYAWCEAKNKCLREWEEKCE